ncbi:MAG: 4Fe-4S dicluster domain-containing protein [Promethearchaeota archaeon]|nr:MAG: 4Fe-4S dicluster domain-containing protein [Candidatus Lokiarchaeota archaeon]
MSSEEHLYRSLQEHLDKQPIGFPATASGSDIRLLKHFFSPNEARILLKLSFRDKSFEEIHELIKKDEMSIEELKNVLDKMISKGNIGWRERDGINYYRIIPLVVGLDESKVYDLSLEYLKLLFEYMIESRFPLKLVTSKVPQLRTIPVEQSITPQHHINNYDKLKSLIENMEGPFVVLDCICKKMAALRGNKCKMTSRLETCFVFGDIAKTWLKRGLGRQISKVETLELLRLGEEEGLVLQSSNSQEPEFICSCCGDCCGILSMQKLIPNPAKFWSSSYYAEIDTELCEGCKTCVERCQVDAIMIKKSKNLAIINLNRCIGCGNCVTTCPTQAIRLVKKKDENLPPKDYIELYEEIMRSENK